jgi:hypothetical protein
MRSFLIAFVVLLSHLLSFTFCLGQNGKSELAEKLMKLTANSEWIKTASVPLRFDAHHTQGIVKIGAHFYMTSVEVEEWPRKYERPQGKLDRDTGKGIGHVMKFDADGNLLHDLVIGEGDIYHPGGIDFDGKYIWIPVTEYRPNSFSIIYRLDPLTMKVEEVLRYPESIGAIIHNTDNHTLVGANWGARRFYTWRMDAFGKVTNGNEAPDRLGIENPSFYVDFQDCKYLGNNLMLGTGLQSFKTEDSTFRLGGLEIFDLNDFRPRRQVPLKLWSAKGASILNNPCDIESTKNGIRAYFVPDDDNDAILYVYEVII